MSIERLFVLGGGFMGGGISQVAATSGFRVTMMDKSGAALQKSLADMRLSLSKLSAKQIITQSPEEIMSRIRTTEDMSEAKDADFVIEAVSEDPELKKKLFRELDELLPPDVIIATNTSAIPVTTIASATKRPDRCIGTHFFSPVPIMDFVEIVRGFETSDETLETTKKLIERIGKTYSVINKDVAGFVMNRLFSAATVEAIRLVEQGVITPAELDKGMRKSYGWAMGPLELIDMTGLDVTYSCIKAIYDETQDEKFAVPLMLQRLVQSGRLGRKTGKGFYDYSK
ncbi:MAG: 3-hydroxyacyl-CoA dehydrogenase family protein [Oscillospiraceae bacterium]|jgi:3-hydroxybutyryl-CoA dehydrogenase